MVRRTTRSSVGRSGIRFDTAVGFSVPELSSLVLFVGIFGSIFVAFNIGGSSAGTGTLLGGRPDQETVRGFLRGEVGKEIALDALTVDQDPPVTEVGEAEPEKVVEEAGDLFDRQALARYVSMWIVGPSVALALSYAYFYAGFVGG
jgi:hypothetical protein